MWKRLHWYEPKRPYIRAQYTKKALPIWGKMALVMRADTHQGAELSATVGRIGFWWGWNGFYWGRYGPTWQNGPTKGQISSRGYRAESALWGWNRSFEFTVEILLNRAKSLNCSFEVLALSLLFEIFSFAVYEFPIVTKLVIEVFNGLRGSSNSCFTNLLCLFTDWTAQKALSVNIFVNVFDGTWWNFLKKTNGLLLWLHVLKWLSQFCNLRRHPVCVGIPSFSNRVNAHIF